MARLMILAVVLLIIWVILDVRYTYKQFMAENRTFPPEVGSDENYNASMDAARNIEGQH